MASASIKLESQVRDEKGLSLTHLFATDSMLFERVRNEKRDGRR